MDRPASNPISRPLARAGWVLGGIGAALALGALLSWSWRERLAAGWLWGSTWIWTLTLGSLFFVALHHATHAVWSVGIRRMAEAFAAAAWLAGIFLLPVLALSLFHEAHEGYSGAPFFIARGLAFVLIGAAFAHRFVGRSLRQDRGDVETTLGLRRTAVVFLLVFAAVVTLASFDWLMRLEPEWHSAAFGVYVFSGMTVAALAAVSLLTLGVRRADGFATSGVATDDHLYSLGALLFAFTCFWAYIAFSQYMLIWYGNIAEETAFFDRRSRGGWLAVSVSLAVVRFAIPFLLLLPRRAKRNGRMLAVASVVALAGQALDLYWIIMPTAHEAGPVLGPAELGPPMMMTGLLMVCVARFLGRHPAVPEGDPLIEDCRRFRLQE